MNKNRFNSEVKSLFNNKILDNISKPDDVVSLSLSIKASHAGKINTNDVFYTPRSMKEGSSTLVAPFPKHIQRLHRGNAVGIINKAEYEDYSHLYSERLQKLNNDINEATTPDELVGAVKELVNSPEYKSNTYKGLGVLKVNADLHDQQLIQELTTGQNKGKVSIGGDSYSVYCSICGEPYSDTHEHQRGFRYKGEECFAIYDNMKLDHIGFVPDPADSNTETSIIQDSIEYRDNTVTINSYKIQDNKQGKQMTFTVEKLKDASKSAKDLLGLEVFKDLAPNVVETFTAKYEAEQKTKKRSDFLFSEDGVLPIKSKETAALATLAVKQLDDTDPEKKAITALVQNACERYFKPEDDVLKFVQDYVVETKAEPVSDPVKDDKTQFQLDNDAVDRIGDLVANKILEGMKTSQKVEDSASSFKQLVTNNKQLTSEINELAEANEILVKDVKQLYIDRITELKDLTKDEDYKSRLGGYDVTSLKNIYTDLTYKAVVKKDKEEKVKEPETKEEVDKENKQTTTEHTDDKKLDKTTISDSIKQTSESAKETETDELTDAQFIKQFGMSAYLKRQRG